MVSNSTTNSSVVYSNDKTSLSCDDLASMLKESSLSKSDFSKEAKRPRVSARQRLARSVHHHAKSLSDGIVGAFEIVAKILKRRPVDAYESQPVDEYECRLQRNLGPELFAAVKRHRARIPFREKFVFKNDLPTERYLLREMEKVRPMYSPLYVPYLETIEEKEEQ